MADALSGEQVPDAAVVIGFPIDLPPAAIGGGDVQVNDPVHLPIDEGADDPDIFMDAQEPEEEDDELAEIAANLARMTNAIRRPRALARRGDRQRRPAPDYRAEIKAHMREAESHMDERWAEMEGRYRESLDKMSTVSRSDTSRLGGDKRPPTRTGTASKMMKYDGTTPWPEFQDHFEQYQEHYEWDDKTKARELRMSLRDEAHTVATNLPPDQRQSYVSLCDALRQTFSPKEKAFLYMAELKALKRKEGEDLGKLVSTI